MDKIVLTGELCLIMSPGVVNKNGTVYTKECMDKSIKEYKQKMLKTQRLEKLQKINNKNGEKC